ncbi:MAG: C1 family peptidase [Flavobacteriales bacterium]|nr:C1 family peptidase [Flavobacteriales bacterium]
MKKINTIFFLALAVASTSVYAQDVLVNKTQGGNIQSVEKFGFTTVKKLPVTSVKNQASSSTCWAYSGISFIESEMLRMGKKPVDLAEMYVVRKVYEQKAEKYVRMHGNNTFAAGAECPDVLDVIKNYGAVPQEVYTGLIYNEEKNNHNELDKKLENYVKEVVSSKVIRGDWQKGFKGILDAYLGDEPKEFTYQGKKYTPRTFADKVVGVNTNDYVYLTSWIDTPYYEKTFLLVPDNWAWEKFYNVPLDDMISAIDNALDKGYTVAWGTDVSENGFSSKLGLAIVPEKEYSKMDVENYNSMFDGPKAEKTITAEMRQKGFDNYTTGDDHGREIVGTAKDVNGKKYYIVKNSWGEERGMNGYIYASEAFVRFKTISVIMHKDAVPTDIAKKLK